MSRPPELRAGIIGAGWIGRSHAEALGRRDDVAVTAVCDLDGERAAGIAAVTGARAFLDYREMLATASLDVLWICTPPNSHLEPAIASLERGLPLYLEKPIARGVGDARRILEAVELSGTVCAIGYQWHAVEVLGDMQRALAGRPVGCLVGASIGGTESRPWFLDRAAGGGNLLERGSHHIDLARVIAGEVVAVQAGASTVRLAPRSGVAGDIDDAVTLILHFANGGIGTIVVAWTSDDLPGSYFVEVTVEGATLRLDLDPTFRLSGVSDGLPVAATTRIHLFDRSVGRFLEAARAGDPGLVFCTPSDATRTLAVAIAAEEALETGRTVPVEAD